MGLLVRSFVALPSSSIFSLLPRDAGTVRRRFCPMVETSGSDLVRIKSTTNPVTMVICNHLKKGIPSGNCNTHTHPECC